MLELVDYSLDFMSLFCDLTISLFLRFSFQIGHLFAKILGFFLIEFCHHELNPDFSLVVICFIW